MRVSTNPLKERIERAKRINTKSQAVMGIADYLLKNKGASYTRHQGAVMVADTEPCIWFSTEDFYRAMDIAGVAINLEHRYR